MSWQRAIEVDALTLEAPRAVRAGGVKLTVVRTEVGIRAIEGRCPHEGYPLATGSVKEGVLTCAWHNWKFRLEDGACLLGGEAVRSFPVEVRGGAVWVDVTEPASAQLVAAAYRALEEALEDPDWGQAARAIERALAAGEPASALLGWAVRRAAGLAPYGFDHGLAAAAPLGRMLTGDAPPGAVLLTALELLLEPHLRRAPVDVAPAEPDVAAGDDHGPRLRALIEAEALVEAEGLVRGALASAVPPARVLTWLTHAATDHFLDFGHGHIYCAEAADLLAVVGDDAADAVLASLCRSLVLGTREDTLPYMQQHQALMTAHAGRLPEWVGRSGGALDSPALIEAVAEGTLSDALGAVAGALDAGAAADRVALALAVAACRRLLRFDGALELRDDVADGWLHVTHALTHADAVRRTLLRDPGVETLRGLFHAARFVQHLRVLDAPHPPSHHGSGAFTLGEAIARRDVDAAMRAAGGRPAETRATLLATTLSDRYVRPIFVAHHVKTVAAAIRVSEALEGDPAIGDPAIPLVAVARWLAHPMQERRVARTAATAAAFARDGRPPPSLVGY